MCTHPSASKLCFMGLPEAKWACYGSGEKDVLCWSNHRRDYSRQWWWERKGMFRVIGDNFLERHWRRPLILMHAGGSLGSSERTLNWLCNVRHCEGIWQHGWHCWGPCGDYQYKNSFGQATSWVSFGCATERWWAWLSRVSGMHKDYLKSWLNEKVHGLYIFIQGGGHTWCLFWCVLSKMPHIQLPLTWSVSQLLDHSWYVLTNTRHMTCPGDAHPLRSTLILKLKKAN